MFMFAMFICAIKCIFAASALVAFLTYVAHVVIHAEDDSLPVDWKKEF